MNFDTTTVLIIVAILAAAIVAWLLLRSRGGARVEDRRPRQEGYVASKDRPYVDKDRTEAKAAPAPTLSREDGPQGNSIADGVATAATDVSGDIIGVEARAELPGAVANPDDLELLKGVGPKFAHRLNECGIYRFDQLAGLNENEAEILDGRLGAFKGRLARDRVIDQARYLARGDVEGFEERFGKLGAK
jgi:predicted flap endonuclease-1-like 5' DNA nuclease